MITSPDNEKLKLIRRLAEPRGRIKEGLFVSEGEDLLAAGRKAGWEPELVLVAAGSDPAGEGAEALEVEAALLDRVSALGSGSRVLAVWELPAPAEPAPGEPGLRVFLDRVSDPGNVGAIVRTAEALAGGRVVLGPGCADPYGPKAVRASMGALFWAPPERGPFELTPGPRLGLVAHGGADLDAALAALAPWTLCLGSERDGLDAATTAACDGVATIPLRGSSESLNVAASAAIALHRISSAARPGSGGNDG